MEVCSICRYCFCEECGGAEECDCCYTVFCKDCQKDEPGARKIVQCESCGWRQCVNCGIRQNTLYDFEECVCCGKFLCKDDYCKSDHVCASPGELVYKVRNAIDGDNAKNLCACGKKHLESPNGQQFMCTWIQG